MRELYTNENCLCCYLYLQSVFYTNENWKTVKKNALKIFWRGPYCLSIPIFHLWKYRNGSAGACYQNDSLSPSWKLFDVETEDSVRTDEDTQMMCIMKLQTPPYIFNAEKQWEAAIRPHPIWRQECQREGVLLRYADNSIFFPRNILGRRASYWWDRPRRERISTKEKSRQRSPGNTKTTPFVQLLRRLIRRRLRHEVETHSFPQFPRVSETTFR